MSEVKQAVETLTGAFKADPDFRYTYQANIAMAFKDETHRYKQRTGKKYLSHADYHEIANTAADNFLTLLSK